MAKVDWHLKYDRRPAPEFAALFAPDCPFRSITEYVPLAPFPVDLQFRASPKSTAQHASVYVGLSSVLDDGEGIPEARHLLMYEVSLTGKLTEIG